jgi:hypothetical protein
MELFCKSIILLVYYYYHNNYSYNYKKICIEKLIGSIITNQTIDCDYMLFGPIISIFLLVLIYLFIYYYFTVVITEGPEDNIKVFQVFYFSNM